MKHNVEKPKPVTLLNVDTFKVSHFDSVKAVANHLNTKPVCVYQSINKMRQGGLNTLRRNFCFYTEDYEKKSKEELKQLVLQHLYPSFVNQDVFVFKINPLNKSIRIIGTYSDVYLFEKFFKHENSITKAAFKESLNEGKLVQNRYAFCYKNEWENAKRTQTLNDIVNRWFELAKDKRENSVVLRKGDELKEFPSISKAARFLNVSRQAVHNAKVRKSYCKGWQVREK